MTIQAGVQVQVSDNMWIRVQGGALNVQGAPGNPVVFTAASNRWRYLSVESGSAQMTHCVIEKAGLVSTEAALRLFVSDVQVQNCTVRNNGGHGIELGGEGSTMLLENVAVTDNAGRAVFQNTINMNPTYRNVMLSGNGLNAVILPPGTLNRDVTLDSTGITGGPLLLDYDLYVPVSTTLTLLPGTTLTVDNDNVWVRVQGGALVAEGTAEKPITLTVNLVDGSSRWRYLSIEANSRARLDYVTLEHAGLYSNEAGLYIQTSDVQMRHSVVRANAGPGIVLSGEGITPTLESVLVTGNGGFAIKQNTVNMNPIYRDVTLTGNGTDAVYLPTGALNRDVTLDGVGIGGKPFILDYDLYVPVSTTLTLRPGTTFAFDLDNVWLRVTGGTLVAEGTATQPITFTAAYTTPRPGLYRMIAIDSGAARFDHCAINSAGLYGSPALLVGSVNQVTVRNCRVYGNSGDGMQVSNNTGAVILENSAFFSNTNGLRLNNAGSVTSANCTFQNNSSYGVLQNSNDTLSYVDNVFSGNGVAGVGINGGTRLAPMTLGPSGNSFRVLGDVTVGPTATLTIQPGVRVDFAQYKGLVVEGTLNAAGSATQPITFTGTAETSDWWWGIIVRNAGSATLEHATVAYAGYWSDNTGVLKSGSGSLILRNSTIRNNGGAGLRILNSTGYHILTGNVFWANSVGVLVQDTTQSVALSGNVFAGNTDFGVRNLNSATVYARQNYWGDASGPTHATLNPAGTGDKVSDNVVFDPWLTALPEGGQMVGDLLFTTRAPAFISPGQTVDYAIQYMNLLTDTVRNALVVVQLPAAGDLVSVSDGGIYWRERDQLFWKLGDLPSGSAGTLSFQVRFLWGLQRNYSDSTITIFTADNYNPGELDRQPYFDYQPVTINTVTPLTQAQFDAQLAASPALQAAYDAALAAGYAYHSAANVTRSDGATVLGAVLVNTARRAARILTLYNNQVLVYTINAGEFIVEDSSGGMRMDLLTRTTGEWGAWAYNPAISALSMAADGCTVNACKRNCRTKIVSWEFVTKKSARIVGWTALSFFSGGGGLLGAAYEVWDTVSTAKEFLYDCRVNCEADPSTHCCTAGQVRYSGGFIGGMTNSCYRERCNAAVGMWVPDGYQTCIAYGQRCVAGVGAGAGCVNCEERLNAQRAQVQAITVSAPEAAQPQGCSATAAGGKPRCRDLKNIQAKDPNALYGPAGDLLPGQTVVYTITYENEGAGRAYGVYVTNPLPDVFDAATLNLHGNGIYIAASREMMWYVGELGPKGAPDSRGAITYTVTLKNSLPSGTVVSNQATVYFPSVPEETPTNAWVNVVAPLAAMPQELTTAYMTPLAITLSGREISGLPLTYEIVDAPYGGILSGTLPNLIYTPAENFTGPDAFAFRVSNGVTTSRAAQVYITVTPVGDTTPPQVVWTDPVSGTKDITVNATPVFTDALGPLYAPVILIGVSEPLSETTVTTSTVVLRLVGGATLTAKVTFDPSGNWIILQPRVPLMTGDYEVLVTTAIADRAANYLVAPYLFRFSTVAPVARYYIYLPLVLRQS
ncbi:MAG: right-handed parallel beta-helix repeat-containing protein [Anaerolineae bacterium]|nr:right-handed parallel beta-helix repeat-containing protein [Anaerolineae bacterium]